MNRKYSKKPKETGTFSGEDAACAAGRQGSLAEMKKKNKKAARIMAIVLIVAAVAVTVLYFLPYDRILSAMFPKETSAEKEENIYFYPSDFETNILTDSEYTSLNRHLAVRMGNETVFIFNGRDAEKYGEAPAVLWRYAQAMINGDADAYNALFSEKYLSEHDAQKDFPMQRVYDFSATCYSEHTFTDEELDGQYEGVTQYRYEVLYSIQYNDGSVRGDMGSGVLKPIYMEILIDKKEETAKINSISYGK